MKAANIRAATAALATFLDENGLTGSVLRATINDGGINVLITGIAMLRLIDQGYGVAVETGDDWHGYSFTEGSITCSARLTDVDVT